MWEVGVHIADVSAFVTEGSALDLEGLARATSVYLVERRIDMIPSRLSTQICSLRCKTDRLAFSVIWILDDEAQIQSVRFEKTVINSVAELCYADAQKHLDEHIRQEDDAIDGIARDCRRLNHLARKLKARRLAAGALTLSSPQAKFVLDESREQPTDLECYQIKEANSLVEEFMLLANISVAQHLHKVFPGRALLRRHPLPSESRLKLLVEAAARVGAQLDVSSSKALADSLDLAGATRGPMFDQALRILATRCMNQAVYFSSGTVSTDEFVHYGLASPIYTHFTSPIRRYADLVVHRLLASSIGLCPSPQQASDRQELQDVCNHLNHRNRQAQMCQRASIELYTVMYFLNREIKAKAIVMAIEEEELVVFVPQYGIDGRILVSLDEGSTPVEDDPNTISNPMDIDTTERIVADPKRHVASVPGLGQIHMFDQVMVRIGVEQGKNGRRKLIYELVSHV
jgi:exosome complex exonuclease DIS3/RRP44